MKILVTGTAGFIGFHLAQVLKNRGDDVLGVDNVNDYYDTDLKNWRLDLLQQKGIETKRLDIAEGDLFLKTVQSFQPEVVVHLAAQAGVRYSLDHPEAYTHSNIEAFLKVLEACRHGGVRRLSYASSSSVYGGLKDLPFSESMRVDTPISLYAATKKANELMAHCYTHLYGFESVGLRFFTVYGPYGRPDMAMWLFTKAILAGDPINVFNGGKMQRDFTYISDIVSGVCGSIDHEIPEPYRVYNLGNHRPEELEDLISILEGELGVKAIRNDMGMQPGDVPATYADIDHAARDLGFKPQTQLKDGVAEFVRWYRDDWTPYKESR